MGRMGNICIRAESLCGFYCDEITLNEVGGRRITGCIRGLSSSFILVAGIPRVLALINLCIAVFRRITSTALSSGRQRRLKKKNGENRRTPAARREIKSHTNEQSLAMLCSTHSTPCRCLVTLFWHSQPRSHAICWAPPLWITSLSFYWRDSSSYEY